MCKILLVIIVIVLILIEIYNSCTEGFKSNDSYENEGLTVIVTTSPIPIHPKIDMIVKVIESIPTTNINKLIITCDGDPNNTEQYKEYKKSLANYAKQSSLNVQIVESNKQVYLTGNIRNALEHVFTKYILVVQHDFAFTKFIDFASVMNDMDTNPVIKYVRFNKRSNDEMIICDYKKNFNYYNLQGRNNVYTKTPCWSDNNHLTTLKYYKDTVMPLCKNVKFMEDEMMKLSNEYPEKFGTFIYGGSTESPSIIHYDGRGTISFNL